jgi:hypothetical protein
MDDDEIRHLGNPHARRTILLIVIVKLGRLVIAISELMSP